MASADKAPEDEYTGEWCFADARGYVTLWAEPSAVLFRMPGYDLPIEEKQVDNMIKLLTNWKNHKEARRG